MGLTWALQYNERRRPEILLNTICLLYEKWTSSSAILVHLTLPLNQVVQFNLIRSEYHSKCVFNSLKTSVHIIWCPSSTISKYSFKVFYMKRRLLITRKSWRNVILHSDMFSTFTFSTVYECVFAEKRLSQLLYTIYIIMVIFLYMIIIDHFV